MALISPPSSVEVGWDAADALAEGWDIARSEALVASAAPTLGSPAEASQARGGRRPAQRDVLIGLTEFVELWHDANRIAYASFQVGGHRENWPVRSREFRMWLSGQFYEATGGAIGGQALEDGIRILEARAVNDGPRYDCFVRSGFLDGKMYIDLGDPTWSAIEITSAGWHVTEKPTLKFLRSPSMRALPVPEAGSLIEELFGFLNVAEK